MILIFMNFVFFVRSIDYLSSCMTRNLLLVHLGILSHFYGIYLVLIGQVISMGSSGEYMIVCEIRVMYMCVCTYVIYFSSKTISYKILKKLSFMARSLPVQYLLPQNVETIINCLQ